MKTNVITIDFKKHSQLTTRLHNNNVVKFKRQDSIHNNQFTFQHVMLRFREKKPIGKDWITSGREIWMYTITALRKIQHQRDCYKQYIQYVRYKGTDKKYTLEELRQELYRAESEV